MATVDEQQRTVLVEKALEAIEKEPSGESHKICREIVETISSACEKNQKEIANELQHLAKALESKKGEKEAFEFKQKTCAIMLEISMEERRKEKVHGQDTMVPQNNNNEEPPKTDENVAESPQSVEPEVRTATIPPHPEAPAPAAQAAPQPAESDQNESQQTQSSNEPPRTRSKIIGLPSQTSVPAQPGSSSSASFFSSKMIGAATGSTQTQTADPNISDTAAGAQEAESAEAAAGVEADGQVKTETGLPFKRLAYLYIGTDDFEATKNYYLDVLKGEEVWSFDKFGSKVTAVKVSPGPLILVSDHRKAPSCQPVFEVEDLTVTVRELKERGWKEKDGPFGTPNGEAYSFIDPSGNSIAIFQVDPDSTDRSYVDPTEY